jgi:hypothetical protein
MAHVTIFRYRISVNTFPAQGTVLYEIDRYSWKAKLG